MIFRKGWLERFIDKSEGRPFLKLLEVKDSWPLEKCNSVIIEEFIERYSWDWVEVEKRWGKEGKDSRIVG